MSAEETDRDPIERDEYAVVDNGFSPMSRHLLDSILRTAGFMQDFLQTRGEALGLEEAATSPARTRRGALIAQLDMKHALGFEGACAICLDEDGLLVEVHCGHAFHGTCIEEWLSQHGTCPICRTKVLDEPSPRRITPTFLGPIGSQPWPLSGPFRPSPSWYDVATDAATDVGQIL